ncbi:MAG: hypothetical protein M3R55_08585 [Acidobacteriota bacterium]|nr:hypothetical protein [Acidobacteriota bacterium]
MSSKSLEAAWLVAAALLSSWAVSSASDQPTRSSTSQAAVERPAADALPAISVELSFETARLAMRLDGRAAPVASSGRDPFTFARRTGARPRAHRAAVAPVASIPSVAPAAVVDVAPAAAPSLAGLAEITAGAVTAVISFREELHYVTKGQLVAGRFRVDVIGADSVDLFDIETSTVVRLSLLSIRTSLVQFAVHQPGMR